MMSSYTHRRSIDSLLDLVSTMVVFRLQNPVYVHQRSRRCKTDSVIIKSGFHCPTHTLPPPAAPVEMRVCESAACQLKGRPCRRRASLFLSSAVDRGRLRECSCWSLWTRYGEGDGLERGGGHRANLQTVSKTNSVLFLKDICISTCLFSACLYGVDCLFHVLVSHLVGQK